MLFICEHGHAFDEEELQKLTVPSVVTNEARIQHELGLCVQLKTDETLRELMKNAAELQPHKYKPLL